MPLPDWLTQVQERVAQFQAEQRPWPWRDHLKRPFSMWGKKKEEEKTGQQLRTERMQKLAASVRAESVDDLRDILSAMVLSECAYKRPVSDMLRHLHRFRNDFGSDLVCLKRVQVSLEHAPHRYLLAEAGDTLFASFIGTKQARDFLADANFLQDALFEGDEDLDDFDADLEARGASAGPSLPPRKRRKRGSKPLVHRGFLARARGIPAVDIYRLARRTNRRLVLCGHSLGGAVAVLVTVAILKAAALTKPGQRRVPVKCITFSQPPVGNAALKDYVHQRGWQHHFRSFCIPEDIIPRILSPAYFQHYSLQAEELAAQAAMLVSTSFPGGQDTRKTGPPLWGALQRGFWRVPKLAPLVGNSRDAAAAWVKRKRGEETGAVPNKGTKFASLSDPSGREKIPSAEIIVQDPTAESLVTASAIGAPDVASTAQSVHNQSVNTNSDLASALYKGGNLGDSNTVPSQRDRDETPLQRVGSSQPVQLARGMWSRVQAGAGRQLGRAGQSNLLPFCNVGVDAPPQTGPAEAPEMVKSAPAEARIVPSTQQPTDSLNTDGSAAREIRNPNPQTLVVEPDQPGPGPLGWGWGWAEQIRDRMPAVMTSMPSMPSVSMPSVSIPSVPIPSVPMPSYVPFGHLYLLMPTHAEHIGSGEYQQLIAAGMRGWMAEVQKRFHSHTMAQYRARFHAMYSLAMAEGSPFPAAVLGQHALPWSAPIDFDDIELGQIAEPTVVRTATSVVPLKWAGSPGQNGAGPIKVDVHGQGLHAVTRVEAQVDGQWCAASIERMLAAPPVWEDAFSEQAPQESIRVHIGPPLRNQGRGDRNLPPNSDPGPAQAGDAQPTDQQTDIPASDEAPEPRWALWRRSFRLPPLPWRPGGTPIPSLEEALSQEEFRGWYDEGPTGEVVVHCSSDFDTSSKSVAMRLRRVRLIGLEGAGKTSLWSALMGQQGEPSLWDDLGVVPDLEWREGVAEGVGYVDGVGVNLQDLPGDAQTLNRELHPHAGPLGRRVDAVVLVHNLASKIPQLRGPRGKPLDKPALSLLLDEVRSSGVPLILAVTNKFASSAERRYPAAASVMEAYHIPPSHVAIVNSRPYVVQGALHPADRAKLVPPAAAVSGRGDGKETERNERAEGARGSAEAKSEGGEDVSRGESKPEAGPTRPPGEGLNSSKAPIASISESLSSLGAGRLSTMELPNFAGSGGTFQGAASFVAAAPRSLNPFRRKELVLPVEGVRELRDLVHSALEMNEEQALRETLEAALMRERSMLAAHNTALANHKKRLGPGTFVGAAMSAGVALVVATFFGSRSAPR